MKPKERAAALSQFVFWARELRNAEGLTQYMTPELQEACALAAEELQYYWALEAERAKLAREKGRKGGRPNTDKPTAGTLRSRKSRQKGKRASG
jgi:hypothetical protein